MLYNARCVNIEADYLRCHGHNSPNRIGLAIELDGRCIRNDPVPLIRSLRLRRPTAHEHQCDREAIPDTQNPKSDHAMRTDNPPKEVLRLTKWQTLRRLAPSQRYFRSFRK